MVKVSEILADKGSMVHTISSEASIVDAIQLMARQNIGAVLVLEGKKIRGIFSERDCVQDLANCPECSLHGPITSFMTTPVYYVTPEQTLDDCMTVMTSKHIRHLPVIDGEDLVGMVSIGDVVKKLLNDREERIKDLENFLWVNLI